MKIYTGLRHRGRGIASLLLCLYLPACASHWRVTNAEPATFVTEKKPAAVRVTTDSIQTVITHPRVAGDSLVGVTSTSTGLGTTREDSTGVVLAAIRKLEVPAQSPGTLTMVVVGAIVLVALIAVASTSWTIDLGG